MMNSSKKPENIYLKIENKEISLYEGIKSLVSLQYISEKNDIILECKETLQKLRKGYSKTLEILKKLFDSNEKAIVRLCAAKELFFNFKDISKSFLENHIHRDSSAFFLTEFYRFLSYQKDKYSQFLKDTLVRKYKRIYEVSYEEAIFFVDLEATQINSKKDLDFIAGYFKKFSTSKIQFLKNGSQFNFAINSNHVRALDLSRWEFDKIPETIGNLSELLYLNLSNLKLNCFPETLNQLAQLNYLNLNGNLLTKIPNWVIKFSEKNTLKSYIIEGVIKTDSKVLSLIEILCGNKIQKAEEKEDILSLETSFNYKINEDGRVIGLYIKDKKVEIGIFPKQICTLEFLQELDLPKSSIETIPECIGNLNALEFLNLPLNRIRSIPKSIEKLRNLEYLNFSHNLLSENDIMELQWNKNGLVPLEQDDFDRAIEECEETLKTYPKNTIALFHLGIAYREIGKLDLAKQAYKRFLDIDPISSVVWSSLSDIYHQEECYDKAIKAINNALGIEPDIALLWSNLGLNYKKLGEYDDAIESYLHSLEIDSNNKYVWKDLASIYRDRGEIMKAIDAEERALEINFRS
ncbi:MAG: tetratricopeptide repeat protein [Candidatus Lokiarchaeota archaeon]|nr:tetratricopeptide repeat protein [Candidatus Lokiarchaeota archaeon]